MSAMEAVKAELEQKKSELAALHEEHDATIAAGRAASRIVWEVVRDVGRLEEALAALEGQTA
jgi:hypothetical protein